MKKASIEQFINRYNLGGEVESVKIESTDSEMIKKSLRCCFDCTCGAAS